MIVWRITRNAFQALDGEGSRLYGGRWNSEGVAVVYTSPTLSLAALEYLVHVDPEDVPRDLVAMKIEVPPRAPIETLDVDKLPGDWAQVPDHPAGVAAGDGWAEGCASLLLRVPSAIISEEFNVLVNAAHPAAARLSVVSVRPFHFDLRLLP